MQKRVRRERHQRVVRYIEDLNAADDDALAGPSSRLLFMTAATLSEPTPRFEGPPRDALPLLARLRLLGIGFSAVGSWQ